MREVKNTETELERDRNVAVFVEVDAVCPDQV